MKGKKKSIVGAAVGHYTVRAVVFQAGCYLRIETVSEVG